MHPLELIISVDRTQAAKDFQQNPTQGAQAASGDANVKKLHETEQLEKEGVPVTDKYEGVDPDGSNKQSAQKKKSSKPPLEQKESQTHDSPPSTPSGNTLDIMA